MLIKPLLWFLIILSFIYGGVISLRIYLYRKGLFKVKRLGATVISIGNLTVGGTGKTPLVIALAEDLSRKGFKVGVLSRGYKGRRSRDLQWVSDGHGLLADPDQVGEEPYLIASRLKGVPVVVGKDRYRSGRSLLSRFKLDTIILDDGFQHLKLDRDINLLVIDGTLPFGFPQGEGRLLPRGTLRESPKGIKRASAVLVSRMEQSDQWGQIVQQVRFHHPDVPMFKVFFKPLSLINLSSEEHESLAFLKGRSVLCFSGIGHPASFRVFLERLGAKVLHEAAFEDHHRYTGRDIDSLIHTAREKGAEILVTTEKDGVKIRRFLNQTDPVWTLRMDIDRIEDRQAWDNFIDGHVKAV
jgi:tetraacyldisaccharide 4'-kinase